jgi:hypothetical protein
VKYILVLKQHKKEKKFSLPRKLPNLFLQPALLQSWANYKQAPLQRIAQPNNGTDLKQRDREIEARGTWVD